MKSKLLPCLALALSVVALGCSSTSRQHTESPSDAKIRSFAAEYLGMDLKSNAFGTPLGNYPGAMKVEHYPRYPFEAKLDWYRLIPEPNKNEQVQRTLELGFSQGRLEAIRLSLGTWFASTNKEAQRAAQASLDSVLSEFRKLSEGHLTYQSGGFWIHYEPFCNLAENIAASILIATPRFAHPTSGSHAPAVPSLSTRVYDAEFIGIVSVSNVTSTAFAANTGGIGTNRFADGSVELLLKGNSDFPKPFKLRQSAWKPDAFWKQLEPGRYLIFGQYSGTRVAITGYYDLAPITGKGLDSDIVYWPLTNTVAEVVEKIREERGLPSQTVSSDTNRHTAVYRVPKSSIHYCRDGAESARRGRIFSADVYRIRTGDQEDWGLELIARDLQVKSTDPEEFSVVVTDVEDSKIRETIDDKAIFIMWYHHGW